MKRERRHELHTNLLAEWLASAITVVKPYLNTILAVALVVLLVSVVAALWTRYSSSGKEEAWDAFNRALQEGYPQPASFDKLAEIYPRSDVAHWSEVTAADLYLQQGCEQILRDKGAANQQLQKALENYLSVLKESKVDALRERATFGLARTYESLSGTRRAENELQKAIETYDLAQGRLCRDGFAPAGGTSLAGDQTLLRQAGPVRPEAGVCRYAGRAGQRLGFGGRAAGARPEAHCAEGRQCAENRQCAEDRRFLREAAGDKDGLPARQDGFPAGQSEVGCQNAARQKVRQGPPGPRRRDPQGCSPRQAQPRPQRPHSIAAHLAPTRNLLPSPPRNQRSHLDGVLQFARGGGNLAKDRDAGSPRGATETAGGVPAHAALRGGLRCEDAACG